MKRLRMIVGGLALLCCFSARTESSEALWNECRRLEKEAVALRMRVNELTDDYMGCEKSAEILDVTGELMTGKRLVPPSGARRFVPVAAFETNAVKVLDNTATGKQMVEIKFLGQSLKAGTEYRFSCKMKAENVKGSENIKFGGYITFASGAETQWPAASVGAGTFDWTEVSFDYVLPTGANVGILYGLESGVGRVSVRDVTVSEIVNE